MSGHAFALIEGGWWRMDPFPFPFAPLARIKNYITITITSARQREWHITHNEIILNTTNFVALSQQHGGKKENGTS